MQLFKKEEGKYLYQEELLQEQVFLALEFMDLIGMET
jgi:hypothetical protein